ncbi:MAG: hypothetical protein KAU20_02955 [Nanoarchaeota archaeon]|nr:hypothetical protein [Nanoarchaeota archaeon]
MKEKTLVKISLVCSLSGIFILFLLFSFIDVDERKINSISEADLEEDAKVTGVVMDIMELEDAVIIEVGQLNKINVIVFDSEVSVKKGDYVEVSGVIEEYKGKLEIIADRIVLK